MKKSSILFTMVPILATALLLVACGAHSYRQGAQIASGPGSVEMTNPSGHDLVIGIGFKRVIHSDIIGEDRELFVYLPNGYDPSKSGSFPTGSCRVALMRSHGAVVA